MLGKGKRSPSSSPSLTLHSTHLARRRSPFGMVRALEKASDGLSSGPLLWGCARAFSWERVCMSACQRRGWNPRNMKLWGAGILYKEPEASAGANLRHDGMSRDGRRGAPGRLLAADRGDRQLTTTAMSLTMSLPSSFKLASDEVHSWCASLDVQPETSARLYATLTPDERTRSARFQFDRDQQRFIVARGVLRDLLGRYLQTQPSRMGFVSHSASLTLALNSATDSNSISLTQPVLPSSPSPLPPTSALISNTSGRNLITPISRGVSSQQLKVTIC